MTQDLLGSIVRLASVLEAENAALAAMDLPAAAALVAEKREATTAFDTARVATPVTPSAALRDAAARLGSQAEDNRRLLERAMKVQTRVLGIIVGAARSSNPVQGYGRSGAYAARAGTGWALSARA